MTGKWFNNITFMVLENTGWLQVQDCKFVDYFTKNGIVFTNWHGVTHPSGPNYRAMLSGQTWSNNEFDGVNRDNISKHVDYMIYDWRGTPAERHNPFKDMNPNFVDLANLGMPKPFDGSSLAYLTYLGMDDANNAHSGPLETADTNVMEAIKAWQWPTNGIFLIVFDEAFGTEYGSNHVFAGVLGAGIKTVMSELSHYNLAQFLADNWSISLPLEADPKCKTYIGKSLFELP